jgi:hypothetical protein
MVPPVIDPSRARVQEAASYSPFNLLNVVAILVILALGFYLYKRFLTKSPQRRFPLVQPVAPKAEAAAPVPAPEEEVPAPPAEEPVEGA